MAGMIPTALFGLHVPCGTEPIPAIPELGPIVSPLLCSAARSLNEITFSMAYVHATIFVMNLLSLRTVSLD